MPLFTITIGPRGAPRETLEAEAPDSLTAMSEHLHLAQPGERVDVAPVPTEEEFAAADVARSVGKAQRLHQCADHRALEDQVQWMRCVGAI